MASFHEPDFNPEKILETLVQFDVDFVIVGAVAGRLQGSPAQTRDLDIMPNTSDENLEKLLKALESIGPVLRITPVFRKPLRTEGLTITDLKDKPAACLFTRFGRVDVMTESLAGKHYEQIVEDSDSFDLGFSDPVRAASLQLIIESKEAANRPKDQAMLPALYAALVEQEAQRKEKLKKKRKKQRK